MASVARALAFVAASGAVVAVGAFALFSPRDGVSATLGAGLGTLNLWLLTKIAKAALDTGNKGWAVIGGLKLVGLLAIMGFLFKKNVVGALPLLAGLGSLPVGIFLAQLTASTRDEDRGAHGA